MQRVMHGQDSRDFLGLCAEHVQVCGTDETSITGCHDSQLVIHYCSLVTTFQTNQSSRYRGFMYRARRRDTQ